MPVQDLGRRTEDPRLGLHPGCEVSERVQLATGRPVEGAEIMSDLTDGRPVHLGGMTYWSRKQDLVLRETSTRTDAQGRYRLRGSPSGDCHVDLVDSEDPPLFPFANSVSRRACAPASDVDFVLEGVELVLEVHGGGKPLQRFRVDLGGGGVYTAIEEARSPLRILLPPRTRFKFTVDGGESFEPQRFELQTGEGTPLSRRINLRSVGRTVVELELAFAGGGSPRRVGIGWKPRGAGRAALPRRVRFQPRLPGCECRVRAPDGEELKVQFIEPYLCRLAKVD